MATLNGQVTTTAGTGYAAILRFTPAYEPNVFSAYTATGWVDSTASSDGTFSVTLLPGNYTVAVKGVPPFMITLPEDTIYRLEEVIVWPVYGPAVGALWLYNPDDTLYYQLICMGTGTGVSPTVDPTGVVSPTGVRATTAWLWNADDVAYRGVTVRGTGITLGVQFLDAATDPTGYVTQTLGVTSVDEGRKRTLIAAGPGTTVGLVVQDE